MKVLFPKKSDELQVSWSEDLRELFSGATKLTIVSPWIKDSALRDVLPRNSKGLSIRVLMRANADDFLLARSDLHVIERLLELGAEIEIRLMSNLHAKVYIADSSKAIVTSGNLTFSGFAGNIELGLLVDSKEEVAHIVDVVNGWFDDAQKVEVDRKWLASMKQEVARLGKEYSNLNLPKDGLPIPDPKLQGGRVDPPKSKRPKKNAEQGIQVVNEEDNDPARILTLLASPELDWKMRIIGHWYHKEEKKKEKLLVEGLVEFVRQSFKYLPEQASEELMFGVLVDYIILTRGHYKLAEINAHNGVLIMLVKNPYLGGEIALSFESEKGINLSCIRFNIEDVYKVISNEKLWISYREAASEILKLPVETRRNVPNKDGHSLHEWLAVRGIDE